MCLVICAIIMLSLRVVWLGSMHKETNLQPVNIAIFVKHPGSLTCFLGLSTSAACLRIWLLKDYGGDYSF